MAGIPWGKYDRADWVRVPGGARRYASVQNPGVTISRRQFDEHYGSAAFHGTYEKKARVNAKEPQQLLRPARGRKSALKLTPAQKEAELARRRVIKQETQQEKLVRKLETKKIRTPQKITLRNFKSGHVIRKIRTGVDQEEIERLRYEGQKSKIIFGYWVGLEMVSERDGQMKSVSLFTQRDIKLPFTDEDMDAAIDVASNKSYAELTGMFIAFHLNKAGAIRNGARKK